MSGPAAFQKAMALLDYPMAVVTAVADGERSGCLVGFHAQCSITPPRYLVFISKANHTFRVAKAATALAVHMLDASQRDLSRLFGEQTSDEIDKFARWPWTPGPDGVPILGGCRVWFVGTIAVRVDGGDHMGFLLDPRNEGSAAEPFRPLGFQQVRDMHPGHPA